MRGQELYRALAADGVIGRGRMEHVKQSPNFLKLQEAMDAGRAGTPGGVMPDEFSLRDLAESLIVNKSDGQPVGATFIQNYFGPNAEYLQEAMGAVDSTAFVGVQGQILINRLLQSYEQEEYVLSRLITPTPTQLNGERIPGIARPGDPGEDVSLVKEGEPFKHLGFGEEYVQTPATDKHGFIIPVTREAVFFDRTGIVLQRAALAGEVLGLSKEKRLLGVVIGADNTYVEKRKGDLAPVSLKTYYAADDNARWTNHFDGNGLVDGTNIDYAEQQFANVVDPNTGEPIAVGGRFVLAPRGKLMTIQQILTASQQYRLTVPGAAQAPGLGGTTNWPGMFTVGDNILKGMGITFGVSQQLRAQLVSRLGLAATDANNYWFYGNLQKAFAYMENWPITVVQAPQNSEAEFNQDIPFRFKASERGVAAIMDPRFIQRHRLISTSSSSGQ
jgi:hypothetical protein